MSFTEQGNPLTGRAWPSSSKESCMYGFHRFPPCVAVLFFVPVSACGGTTSVDDDAGPPLTAGVDGLVGDWLEIGCVASSNQSFKRLVRAERTDSGIAYSEGVVSYANESCSGAGALVGPSRLGDVAFSRSESNARVAASWGEFTTVSSTRSAVIWTKKSETVLCLLGDESPSILPTLAAVAASVATLPDLGCFASVEVP